MNVNLQVLMRDPIISQLLGGLALAAKDGVPVTMWDRVVYLARLVLQGQTQISIQHVMAVFRLAKPKFVTKDTSGREARVQEQQCWADGLENLMDVIMDTMPFENKVCLSHKYCV